MTHEHHLPGYLVGFEGIDGAGKTTQAHHLQAALQRRGLVVIRTKEPTGGKWGQVLRDSALTGRLSVEDEVETFIKDRQEHVANTILPALREGHVVIVDRYYFSTVAYQGARGLDPSGLLARNEAFAPEPDLLVLLDIDPKLGLERIKMRGDRANHFEKTNSLRKARDIFNGLQKPYLYRLDARLPVEELQRLILGQFSRAATERIARTGVGAEQLDQVLKIHGGSPVAG